jgi:AcrR family transcriptional regulator
MASPSVAATRPPRRTQAKRSADTQAALLDATLACLIEHGYARVTTTQIEARAGTSRGARLHHYPTKSALVSAAVERLYAGIARRYGEAMERVAPDADRFRAGFRLLWQTYVEPAHGAVLELYIAARTDEDLRERLRELSERHHQLVRRRANGYFPSLANRDANGLLETLQATLTGLAVRRLVHGDRVEDEQVLDLIERMVARTFDAAGDASNPSDAPPNVGARSETEKT